MCWWAGLDGGGRLVDPYLGGQGFRLRAAAAESFGVRRVGGAEGGGAAGLDLGPRAVVDGRGSVHRDTGVPVLVVVVSKECPAENIGVLDGPELAGERRAVLKRLVVNTNVEGGRWQFTGRGAVREMEVCWSSIVALRGEALNHPELHWLKTVVVNVAGKGAARLRQVRSGKMSDGRKSSVVDVSK